MSRWGPKQKAPELTPEQKEIAFCRAVAEHIAAGKVSTPAGVIKIPTGIAFPKPKDAIRCPNCKLEKYAPRPHQYGERFCFGCGYIGV
jgi:hypothetical protein